MQIFMPYPDLKKSVECLDNKRLGNQVYRECLTLVRGGWPNHPVSKMWANYKPQIIAYAFHGLEELKRRGFNRSKYSNCIRKFIHELDQVAAPYIEEYLVRFNIDGEFVITGPMPKWFGDERYHSSHRAALLYKNYSHYSQFGWKEKPAQPDSKGRLPYFWPAIEEPVHA